MTYLWETVKVRVVSSCLACIKIMHIPLRTISTLEIASGMQPPAARNVNPITDSGTANVYPAQQQHQQRSVQPTTQTHPSPLSPIIVIIHTIRYEFRPMNSTHMTNVIGYRRRHVFGFGMHTVSTHLIGHVYAHHSVRSRLPSGMRHRLLRLPFSTDDEAVSDDAAVAAATAAIRSRSASAMRDVNESWCRIAAGQWAATGGIASAGWPCCSSSSERLLMVYVPEEMDGTKSHGLGKSLRRTWGWTRYLCWISEVSRATGPKWPCCNVHH